MAAPILSPEDVRRCRDIVLRDADRVAMIVSAVAEATGIHSKAILGVRRDKATAQARQLVMYIARREGLTFEAIAYQLRRDHTTILHGVRAEKKRRGEA